MLWSSFHQRGAYCKKQGADKKQSAASLSFLLKKTKITQVGPPSYPIGCSGSPTSSKNWCVVYISVVKCKTSMWIKKVKKSTFINNYKKKPRLISSEGGSAVKVDQQWRWISSEDRSAITEKAKVDEPFYTDTRVPTTDTYLTIASQCWFLLTYLHSWSTFTADPPSLLIHLHCWSTFTPATP